MTVEMFDEDTPPAEQLFVAWLMPVGDTRIRVNDDTPLPVRKVQEIFAEDDCNLFTSRSVVSVDTRCDANIDHAEVAADAEARATHRRILYLKHHPDTVITLPDGQQVTVDYLEVVQRPIWIEDDNDQILCKQSRYEVGFTFVAVS